MEKKVEKQDRAANAERRRERRKRIAGRQQTSEREREREGKSQEATHNSNTRQESTTHSDSQRAKVKRARKTSQDSDGLLLCLSTTGHSNPGAKSAGRVTKPERCGAIVATVCEPCLLCPDSRTRGRDGICKKSGIRTRRHGVAVEEGGREREVLARESSNAVEW